MYQRGVRATVLLADDNDFMRRMIRELLESRRYGVMEAEHGAEAMRLEEEHRGEIDILLTDLLMPGIRGQELAETLKVINPQLPVIFMTSYNETDIQRWHLNPDIPLIIKPPNMDELEATIERLLGRQK